MHFQSSNPRLVSPARRSGRVSGPTDEGRRPRMPMTFPKVVFELVMMTAAVGRTEPGRLKAAPADDDGADDEQDMTAGTSLLRYCTSTQASAG